MEVAWDTMLYTVPQVEHVVRAAFALARGRRKRLTSIDKANVLRSSRLWRSVVERVAREFKDIAVEHLIVDNASLQLIRMPQRFDVVVSENTFGDILSDEHRGCLSGSLGMLPSASHRRQRARPLTSTVHGAAPDIDRQGRGESDSAPSCRRTALEYGLQLARAGARRIEAAVASVLAADVRTADVRERAAHRRGHAAHGRARGEADRCRMSRVYHTRHAHA